MKVTETCESCGQFPIDTDTLVEFVSKDEVVYSTRCLGCGCSGPDVIITD